MSPLRNEIQTFVSALPISNHDMSSPPSSVQPTFQKIKTLFSTTYFPFKLEKYATATDTSSENRKTGSLMPAPTKSNASPAVNSSPEETSGSSGSLSSATSTSDTLAIVQGMEMFGPTPSPSTLPWAIVSKTQEPETGFTSLMRTTTTPEMSSPSRRATASAYASPSIAPLDAETRPLLGNATVAQAIVSVSPIRDLSSSPRYVQPASQESNTSATLQVPSSLLPSSTFQASKKYNADLRSTRQLRSTTPNLSVTAYSLSETGSTSTGISSESANKKTVPGLLMPAATTPVKVTSTSDAFAVVQGLEIFGLLQVRMSTIVLGVPSSTTETVYTLPPPFETVHIVVPPGVWPSSGGRRAGTGPPLSVSVFVLPSDRNVLPASSCGPAVGLGPIGTRLSGQLLVSVPCGGLPPRGLSPAGFAFDKASGNWTPVALKSGPGYNGSNSTAWAQTPVVGPIAAGWVPNQISSVEQSSDGPSDQGVVIGSVLGAVSFVLVSVAIATAGRRMQSQCVEGQSVVQFSKRPTGDKFIPTSPDKSVMGEENDRKEEESQRLQHTSSSWTPENPTAKYIDERCSSEIDLDRSLVLRLSFDQMEICSEISSSRSSADLDAGPQRSLAQLCRADTVSDITGSCPGGPDIQQAGMTKDVSNCGRSGSDLGVPKDHTATRKQEPVPEWGSCTAAYKDGAGFREGFVSIRVAHPDASDAKVAQMQPSAKAASSGGKQRQDNEVVAGAQGAASELWGLWGDWEALVSVRDTETAIKRLSSHQDDGVQRSVFTVPEATATRMHKVNSEAAVLRVFQVNHKETDSARQRSTRITDGPETGTLPAVNIRCAAGQTEAAAPKTNAGSKVSSACTRDPYFDDDASRTECEVLPGVHSAPSPALEVLLSGVSEAFKLSTASPDQLAAVKGKIAQGEKRQMSQLSSSFRTPGGSEYVDQLQRRSSETETLRVFDQMEICSELFSSRSSPGSDLETGPFRVDNEEVNSAWQRSTQITAGPEKGGLLAVSIQGAAVETEATAPKTNAAPRAISAGTRDLGLDDARRTAGEMLPGVYGDASLKVLRSGDSEALSAASPDQPELAAVKEKLVRGGEIHRGLLFSRFRTPGGPEYVDQRRSSETATLFDQMEICSEISSSRSSIG